MEKEDLISGFIIVNGIAKPLPNNLFDIPSKEEEQELIKFITQKLLTDLYGGIN